MGLESFNSARRKLLQSLAEAAPVVDDITATFPELANYPIGVGLTTTANLAAVLQSIPRMISLSEKTTKSLADIAQSISIPEAALMGIAVGWNYIDALASIINGINLIMDEENYHQTQNKVKGILSIISGAQAFAFSYNPALAVTASLGAASFAAPSFAFMMLADLVNASIDFYNANKKVTIENWLDEQVKEINYLTDRINKLDEENSANKITELKIKKENLINDLRIRSIVYCYGDGKIKQEEFERRKKLVNDKLLDDKLEITFSEMPSEVEVARDKAIQLSLEKNYAEKRDNVITKGLSFSGMTLLAIAPFAGPAAPVLYGTGLIITLIVAGLYLYKHREKIHGLGQSLLDKAESVFKNEEEQVEQNPFSASF